MKYVLLWWAWSAVALAETSRVDAAGYVRIMTRPDLAGGSSKLGFSNLYGRLLNEGPWGALHLRLDVLPKSESGSWTWATVHTQIEGGSFANADAASGALTRFRVSQLYLEGGGMLGPVTLRMGTLEYYLGELSLYDIRLAQVFTHAIGAMAQYRAGAVELLAGLGDAGFGLRPSAYNTILTAGALVRFRPRDKLELSVGAEGFFEPRSASNPLAPHETPGVLYEDFLRGEVVRRYIEDNPTRELWFPKPRATSAGSFALVGYLGFGAGPLRWNSLFVRYSVEHPQGFVRETYAGHDYTIYTHALTDQRTSLRVGDELQLTLWPGRLEVLWAALYGIDKDADDPSASERNRVLGSTVLRLHAYLTQVVHALLESSVAQEWSLQGNLWREHFDSLRQSAHGSANTRGLEFGDTARRTTWQLKGGLVFNPQGPGVFSRPSLRLLVGLQRSNVHAAFASSLSESLSESSDFRAAGDRHWHVLGAIEAETWY